MEVKGREPKNEVDISIFQSLSTARAVIVLVHSYLVKPLMSLLIFFTLSYFLRSHPCDLPNNKNAPKGKR